MSLRYFLSGALGLLLAASCGSPVDVGTVISSARGDASQPISDPPAQMQDAMARDTALSQLERICLLTGGRLEVDQACDDHAEYKACACTNGRCFETLWGCSKPPGSGPPDAGVADRP